MSKNRVSDTYQLFLHILHIPLHPYTQLQRAPHVLKLAGWTNSKNNAQDDEYD